MRKSRMSTFEFKHKCPDCNTTFKNALLLGRHICPKKIKKSNVCHICKHSFDSVIALNVHKKKHQSNEIQISFKKPDPSKHLKVFKKTEETTVSTDAATSRAALKFSEGPRRQTLLPKRNLDCVNNYKCENCNNTFKNSILLKRHTCAADKKNQFTCAVCNASFSDNVVFNIHKKKHIKESLVQSTSEVNITPSKCLPKGKKSLSLHSSRQSFGRLKVTKNASPSYKVSFF